MSMFDGPPKFDRQPDGSVVVTMCGSSTTLTATEWCEAIAKAAADRPVGMAAAFHQVILRPGGAVTMEHVGEKPFSPGRSPVDSRPPRMGGG